MIGRTNLNMIILVLMVCVIAVPSAVRSDVVDAYFRPDVLFPQFIQFWSDSSLEENEHYGKQMDFSNVKHPVGGTLHVYLVNTAKQTVKIEDVQLDGVGLKNAIVFSDQRKFKKVTYAASMFFSKLSESQKSALTNAGEPVWYKVEPETLKPGESAQVIVRLRTFPKNNAVKVALNYNGGGSKDITVNVGGNLPSMAGISFSPEMDKAYLYLKHPQKGRSASKILMDGKDITGQSTIARDASMEVLPVVCRLNTPLIRGSVHCFQAIYDDGSKATAAIRAYAGDLTYAVWGGKPGKKPDMAIGRAFIQELGEHNVNCMMEIVGSEAVRSYIYSDEGKKVLSSLGISRIVGEPQKWAKPVAYYLADEPDTADVKVQGVPPQSKIGCLGQGLLKRAAELREINPDSPNMLNVDMTFKPQNWYTYGQLPDIYGADPYYQTRLCQAYWDMPGRIPAYSKCTFVHAVASICESACAPNPLHIILSCARRVDQDRKFRWGTPEEKRIELYYALAAGAKAFSFWWYTPLNSNDREGADGCGNPDPQARALWDEIGMLGAEARTAGSLITTGCPASLDITAPRKLWVKSILSGTDTLVILCVNDDYANDRVGTVIKPVEKADLSLSLPSWINVKNVFEINCNGIHDVTSDMDKGKLNIHLGTVNVTRMIVVTGDSNLQSNLRKLYDSKFAANVGKLSSAAR